MHEKPRQNLSRDSSREAEHSSLPCPRRSASGLGRMDCPVTFPETRERIEMTLTHCELRRLSDSSTLIVSRTISLIKP
jgi:hypothetical protein